MAAAPALRIVHLSDLHVRRRRHGLAEGLLAAVTALAPDLVVISGDITTRARRHEIAAARALLARLPAPWRAVPGNHDLPLDPVLRLFAPWRRLRAVSGSGKLPPGLSLGLVRTPPPLAFSRGRIGAKAAAALAESLAAVAGSRLVVGHHPPRRPDDGIASALAGAGAQIYLCGHLHRFRLGCADGTLVVGAPAALADEPPGTAAGFLVLDLRKDVLCITHHEAAENRFRPVARYRLRHHARPTSGSARATT